LLFTFGLTDFWLSKVLSIKSIFY